MKLLTGFLIVTLLILLVLGYSATHYAETLPELPDPVEYFRSDVYSKKLPYTKAAGSRVRLVNYKNATDPTWDELLSFLASDDTDEQLYIDGTFVCADFAEMLHNNAEIAGIKTAFIGVQLVSDEVEGHALNAINTTDKGLVYVDCTGEGFQHPVSPDQIVKHSSKDCPHFNYSCDKIAYVVEGKEYGLISIDGATSRGYWFYEDYAAKWDVHNQELELHNNEVKDYNEAIAAHAKEVSAYEAAAGGRTCIRDTEEYERLNNMYNALKAKEKDLAQEGDELDAKRERLMERQSDLGWYCWKPLGVVTNVEINW